MSVNVAVVDLAAFIVTAQGLVPNEAHPAPLQPVNVEPAVGLAVNVTSSLKSYTSLQSPPQLIPAGKDVTVPAPVPSLDTDNKNVSNVNVAVVDLAAFIVTAQGLVPNEAHPAPLQPVNVEPAVGLAVNVTSSLKSYTSLQSPPQLIPAGKDVTVPAPVPSLDTDNKNVSNVNVAVTDLSAFINTSHEPGNEGPHPAPFQAVNVEFAPGTAVNVTTVPKP